MRETGHISEMHRRNRKGATLVEMTLVGIPIIFILISIFEISRGMWIYDTAAHAVREGVRFATVHGVTCVNNPPTITNNCGATVAGVAQVIRDAGVGMDPSTTTVTFTAPSPGGTPITCALDSCPSTTWPPASSNDVGTIIQIDISTPFTSALAMFWPGAAYVNFTTANLGATSLDAIQF